MRGSLPEQHGAGWCVERLPGRPHEVDRAREHAAVDHDFDQVIVAHPADRAAVQRLRADVSHAGATREPGKAAVGEERDVFPPGEIPERGSDLDRKSTRLNSSHVAISYAVFC